VSPWWLALGLGCGWWSAEPAAQAPVVPPVQVVEIRPAEGPLQTLLAIEYSAARSAGRTAYAQVYADWCGPCVQLREAMPDPRMQHAFEGVHVVRVAYDAWQVPLNALLGRIDGPPVPVFYEIGPGGELTRSLDGSAWGANVPENMAGPLRAFFAGDAAPVASP
jgi:hypothetical protein